MTIHFFRRTPPVHQLVQYVDTIENFQIAMSELMPTIPVLEDPATPGKAMVIIQDQVFRLNVTDWIGTVDSQVEVHNDGEMQGYGNTFTEYTPPTPPAE